MSKPEWTKGKILWSQNFDEKTSESFAQAWLRLFGEEICYWNEYLVDTFSDNYSGFILTTKGRVLCFTSNGGHIQLDPTYNKTMFKNIQLDPKITFTSSVYEYLFGSQLANQGCSELEGVVIQHLREIEAIGVKVYISYFNNEKFEYEVIGTEDSRKRVDTLMKQCEVELAEIRNRSGFQKMLVKIGNLVRGGFNNPSLAQADGMSIVLPEKDMKPAVVEKKIDKASNSAKMLPFTKVRSKGLIAWLRGSFNNPIDFESELEKVLRQQELNRNALNSGELTTKGVIRFAKEAKRLEKEAKYLRSQIANTRSKKSA